MLKLNVEKFCQKPRAADAVFFACFTVLITLQPFFLQGEINLFELGLYLPGIDALFRGLVPYRDFFQLRGPLEIYIPAFLMSVFGKNISVLSTYFYVGTIATLITGVLIARNIFKTRLIFYLFGAVFVARTFPRVFFSYWGGFRYGFGFLAVFFAVYFFRRKYRFFVFLSGIFSSLAFLTSVDVGISAILGIVAVFILGMFFLQEERQALSRALAAYGAGVAAILLPYGLYLFFTQSLGPYLASIFSVANTMSKVVQDSAYADQPGNFKDAVLGMNPFSPHFDRLTPIYCFLFFLGYLIFQKRKGHLQAGHLPVVCVASYGWFLYLLTFRKIGGPQFEMALQPEKIVLFFMLEEAFCFLSAKKSAFLKSKILEKSQRPAAIHRLKIYGIDFLIITLIGSSLGYAIDRYNRRFVAFQHARDFILQKNQDRLIPLSSEKKEALQIERVKGMVVPAWQAEDIVGVTEFIQANTRPHEPVFMFPEIGAYYFIVDRPFVSRFPVPTFAWFGGWHEELFQAFKNARPHIVITAKDPGEFFPKVYFKIQKNKESFEQVSQFIEDNYRIVKSTYSLNFYKIK